MVEKQIFNIKRKTLDEHGPEKDPSKRYIYIATDPIKCVLCGRLYANKTSYDDHIICCMKEHPEEAKELRGENVKSKLKYNSILYCLLI